MTALAVLAFLFVSVGIALSVTASTWRRRYTVATATGAVIGALIGVCIGFALCVDPKMPPWIITIPLGGVVGGLILGFVFAVPVALVHGVWWIIAGRHKQTPADADAPLLP